MTHITSRLYKISKSSVLVIVPFYQYLTTVFFFMINEFQSKIKFWLIDAFSILWFLDFENFSIDVVMSVVPNFIIGYLFSIKFLFIKGVDLDTFVLELCHTQSERSTVTWVFLEILILVTSTLPMKRKPRFPEDTQKKYSSGIKLEIVKVYLRLKLLELIVYMHFIVSCLLFVHTLYFNINIFTFYDALVVYILTSKVLVKK